MLPGGTMPAKSADRKLAAILAADVAGFSRLIGADEEGTLSRLTSIRRDPTVSTHTRSSGATSLAAVAEALNSQTNQSWGTRGYLQCSERARSG